MVGCICNITMEQELRLTKKETQRLEDFGEIALERDKKMFRILLDRRED